MIYLILALIIAICIIVIYFNFKALKKEKKKSKDLEEKNRVIRRNLAILKDNSTAIHEIKQQKTKIDMKIKEAKTDEEVNNVLCDILDFNNSRVQDD